MLRNLPTVYKFAAKNLKLLPPLIYTGVQKACISFSLISIPTFISYFGTNEHKLAKGEEDIINKLGVSLFAMNLFSNIGQEVSPLLCGAYSESCKAFSRISSYALQTHIFGQYTATGFVKGAAAEIIGFNYFGFAIPEALGTAADPAFGQIHKNFNDGQSLDFNVTEKVQEALKNNFIRDQIVAIHVFAAASCFYEPIALSGKLPHLINGESDSAIATNLVLAYYTYKDINTTIVAQTTENLFQGYSNYFAGNSTKSDEF